MDIQSILKEARPSIEWTYDKLMDVYGSVPYTKPNGADGVKFDVIETNVKCRLSVVKLANTEQKETNKLFETLKLFCSPDIEIAPGSKISIDGEKYETTSTDKPMVYVTHQEVYLNRKEWV